MSSEEIKLLWQTILEIQKNTSIMNRELGMIQAELSIIKWFLAGIIMISLGSIVPAIWSLLLHRRNNKK